VSHDRYFIDRLATRVLEVENGSVTSYEGNYGDYLRRKEALAAGDLAANELVAKVVSQHPANGASAAQATSTEARDSAPKERSRRLNPIKQKQMEERCSFLEEETPRIEAAIAHTERELGVYVSAAESERLTRLAEDLRAQLAALMAEWEDLMMQLE